MSCSDGSTVHPIQIFGLLGPSGGGNKGKEDSLRVPTPLTLMILEREVEHKFGHFDWTVVSGSVGFMGCSDRSPHGKGTKVKHTFADQRDFEKIMKQALQASDQPLRFCATLESAKAQMQAAQAMSKKDTGAARHVRTGSTQRGGGGRIEVR